MRSTRSTLDEAPADIQAIILEAGKEAGAYCDNLIDSEAATTRDSETSACSVNDIAQVLLTQAVGPIYAQYRNEMCDITTAFLKLMNHYQGAGVTFPLVSHQRSWRWKIIAQTTSSSISCA